MRPQHDAAENPLSVEVHCGEPRASMRPQHDAAENILIAVLGAIALSGFNEAAA